ncbi:hypothetical protein Tco_1111567 [Tanacetum coccineum]|uniref:Uncharacterized protein n=1 Tax=Tanacetum coccineum TaxID=301880 RepID=A0ABQ5IQE4_9ASTR
MNVSGLCPDCDSSQMTNFQRFYIPLVDDLPLVMTSQVMLEVIHEMRFLKLIRYPLFDIVRKAFLIDSLLDEFAGELITMPTRIINREHEEYISLMESNSLREEIDIFPGPDDSIPPGIESDNYDLEGDDNSTSLPENKIYDPGKCIEVESTRFLATLSPVIDTLLPFSSENEDKVFNHGVLASKEKSPHLLSRWAFNPSKIISDFSKSPMMISGGYIPILDVPIAPDFEASRARGFVLRSLELQSFA